MKVYARVDKWWDTRIFNDKALINHAKELCENEYSEDAQPQIETVKDAILELGFLDFVVKEFEANNNCKNDQPLFYYDDLGEQKLIFSINELNEFAIKSGVKVDVADPTDYFKLLQALEDKEIYIETIKLEKDE